MWASIVCIRKVYWESMIWRCERYCTQFLVSTLCLAQFFICICLRNWKTFSIISVNSVRGRGMMQAWTQMHGNDSRLQEIPQVCYSRYHISTYIYSTQRTLCVCHSKKIISIPTIVLFICGGREDYMGKRMQSSSGDEQIWRDLKRRDSLRTHLRGGISCQFKWQIRLQDEHKNQYEVFFPL